MAMRTEDILDALSHVRRRRLMVALLDDSRGRESSIPIEEWTGLDTPGRMVEMKHLHLPKLADYGVIRWNRENGDVARGPNFEDVRPVLEVLVEHEDELPEDWL